MAKKRVLIIGDSISIGYTPIVQKKMNAEAVVWRPSKNGAPENCSATNIGVANIDRWLALGGGKWDVIHFNWGLHDLKHVQTPGDGKRTSLKAEDPVNIPVEEYVKNLRELVTKMKATGAKLIFATTTPCPEVTRGIYRDNKDVIKYNEAAVKLMKEMGVAVNDLYAVVEPKQKELQIQPGNVHFTPQGSEFLGEEVVKSLRVALK